MLLLTRLIDATPPLPQSVVALNELRLNPDRSMKEVVRIVASDLVLSSKLLALVNTPYYATKAQISSIDVACSYLGENIIFSMALLMGLHGRLGFDLSAYDLNESRFLHRTLAQSQLMHQWVVTSNVPHGDALRLAAFVSEIGKILIAHLLRQEDTTQQFAARLRSGVLESVVEKEFVGVTTLEVSALMLEHWRVHSGASAILKYTASNREVPDALKHAVAMLESVRALWPQWHKEAQQIRNEAVMGFSMVENSSYGAFAMALETVLSRRIAS